MIKINYVHAADEVSWKGCYNEDNEEKNYAFYPEDFYIAKTISGDSYSLKLYGKKCRPQVPVFEGKYNTSSDQYGSSDDDGITVSLTSASGTQKFGSVQTKPVEVGTEGKLDHGRFSNLGSGFTWFDDTYTDKYCSKEFTVSAGGTSKTIKYDTSMTSSPYIKLP